MNCPNCGRPALKIANAIAAFVCVRCDEQIPPDATKTALPAPPKPKPIKAPIEREAGLVDAIVQILELYGYTVLRVGQWRADKSGTTAGTPDLFVGREGSALWLGMEVKTVTGRLSEAQKDLNEKKMTCVVRSPQQALHESKMLLEETAE